MIQATINDNFIEAFLYEKFNGDKKKITDYINDFLYRYLPKEQEDVSFEENRKRLHKTYSRMKSGEEEMFSEEEANRRTEVFLKRL